MASAEQNGTLGGPTLTFTGSDERTISFPDNLAKPSSGSSMTSSKRQQMEEDGEEAIEYDSDPEHAQDWSKTTDPKDSWAVRERRKSSKFAKGPVMPNPHAPRDNDRRGSVLSLFKTGNDFKSGSSVIHSGAEDHPQEWTAQKETRSLSTGSEEAKRRGSILSMFTTGKDPKGRHVMSSDWDEHVEEEAEPKAVPRTLTRVERLEAELKEARELEARQAAAKGMTT